MSRTTTVQMGNPSHIPLRESEAVRRICGRIDSPTQRLEQLPSVIRSIFTPIIVTTNERSFPSICGTNKQLEFQAGVSTVRYSSSPQASVLRPRNRAHRGRSYTNPPQLS
jgi:hypothetical protein